MKPIRLYVYLFAAVVLFTGAAVVSCKAATSPYPHTEDGIIDLDNRDFPQGLVSLDGEWEFYWMKLLPPSSFNSKNLSVPDGYITVPGAWNGFTVGKDILDGKGYATYRLRINTKFKGLMGLNIPGMATAYRLWVNGELVSSNGTVGTSPRESIPQYLQRAVYFYSDGNPFEIVVHISNFNHRKGGMWQSISIGDAAGVQKQWQRTTSIQIFLAGSLLVIAFYHFIFFFFRREERFILYFALLCLLIALRTGFSQTGIIVQTIPDLPWWLITRIEYLTAFAAPSVFILFLYRILATETSDKIFTQLRRIAVWIGIVACFLVLVSPVMVFSYLIVPLSIYFIFCASLCLWIMLRAIAQKKMGSVPLLITFLILITAVGNDFLYNTQIINTGNLSAFAVLLFVAVQSIFVSLRYSVAFHDVELLSKQLVANNSMIQKLSNQIDQKNLEMSQRLYTDRLTGLPNRQSLFVDIHATACPTLLLIDIDSFKEINDFYGNRIGDFVLKEVASHLSTLINEVTNKLYKLSVDEYAILIDDEVMDAKKLTFFAQTVCREVSRKAITHGNNEIYIRITIGAALGTLADGKKTSEDIIVRADMALKRAKRFSKQFLMYNDSMEIIKEYEKNMHWARKLKEAVEQNRIIPYFQPIVNIASGKIEKYECLIRFIDDDGSVISPVQFLDIAHKCRMYPELMRIMIEKTFATFKTSSYEFSINLSVDDILDEETRDFILGTLLMNREAAGRAIFEILESQDIENYTEILDFITEVKSFGCRIAVDDFGSGYSNFEHLMKLNIDFIKIDSTLVKNVHLDRNSQVIVKTISVFAKELGIKTVAEFVHCKEVLSKVKELGIDYAQGYYLGEPKDILPDSTHMPI